MFAFQVGLSNLRVFLEDLMNNDDNCGIDHSILKIAVAILSALTLLKIVIVEVRSVLELLFH